MGPAAEALLERRSASISEAFRWYRRAATGSSVRARARAAEEVAHRDFTPQRSHQEGARREERGVSNGPWARLSPAGEVVLLPHVHAFAADFHIVPALLAKSELTMVRRAGCVTWRVGSIPRASTHSQHCPLGCTAAVVPGCAA